MPDPFTVPADLLQDLPPLAGRAALLQDVQPLAAPEDSRQEAALCRPHPHRSRHKRQFLLHLRPLLQQERQDRAEMRPEKAGSLTVT